MIRLRFRVLMGNPLLRCWIWSVVAVCIVGSSSSAQQQASSNRRIPRVWDEIALCVLPYAVRSAT